MKEKSFKLDFVKIKTFILQMIYQENERQITDWRKNWKIHF